MRRSGPVGGGGVGGFSKPPPAPLTHGSSGRVRLHTPEVNGTLGKDRFGSPRERSPSLVGSLPLSPSHPSSREKSPNPASQDLHDCSMCLSAYIQSLNTVCGTACRLSQCLAQVSSENGLGDPYINAGQVTSNPAREAADAWEGVARAVGVASAAVKTQMLVLLQEVQSRPDISDTIRRQEINRVTQAMLSAFLGLQYQFSAVVIERFTGILQNLRDESQYASSQSQTGMLLNKSSNSGGPPHPTDLTQGSSQYPQSGQQPWVPGQQQQQQQQVTTGSMKNMQAVPLLESPGKEEKARSRHPSGGHSRHSSSAPGWSNTSSGVTGCPSSTSYSSNSNYGSSLSLSVNTLSPGSCYGLFPYMNGSSSGWPNDAISRRWSMGGPSTDGWERNSSLGPFTLIANRRWSVPEASEHDVNTQSESDTDFYGCGLQGDWNGTMGSSAASWGSRGGLHVPSRDSSVTRSPSHSRSVTPDPGRQPSFVSNEELQEVIDLLSLPIITDVIGSGITVGSVGGSGNGVGGGFSGFGAPGGGGSVVSGCGAGETSGNGSGNGGGGCSSGGGGGRGGASPVTFSPSHHSSLTQLFEEANKLQQKQQQQQQPASVQKKPLSTPNSQAQTQFLDQVTPPPAQQSPQPAPSGQHQQQLPSKSCSSSGHQIGEVVVEVSESDTQVSTPIWPPSGIAPEGITCERRNSSSLGRDAPNRASWPAASSLLWAGLDGFISEGESEEGGNVSPINLPQYRRHSTDITHLSFNSTSPLIAKTKSSDNITVGNELSGKCSCAEGNLQRLLFLNSILPAPAPPTPTSQYSLFSST
ncbi:protein lingerer-like isoform X2 [Palaemon carinicauda]|uniref:protein lingerer-like isoform X2 n=1 Tax=Palaemon carinicauda TaxID=392227 RepID=UPI0035B60213